MTQRRPVSFVLIPGAGGDSWYWHRVVAGLTARGQEALAVDLPAADETAGLSAYADTIVDTIEDTIEDRDVVLVAQSMGGFVAPLVCERVRVALLVMVNAMIPRSGESGGAWWSATGQPEARAALAAAQGRMASNEIDVIDEYFHDVPDDVTAEAMRRGEPHQSGTPFIEPFPLRNWPDVPTRVVVGRDDRLFPAAFQRRICEERLGVTPDEIAGGHLVALANPEGVVERLESYVAAVG